MPDPDRLVFVLATALALPGAAAASVAEVSQFPADATVARILDERVEAGRALGLVVGLLDEDGTTRVFSAGTAGAGARPLAATSVFQVGSISKVLTGTLLADMARRGEVSPDDPVEMYLPEGVALSPRAGGSITLADLATHRSGLPYVPDDMPIADPSDPYADYTVAHLYDLVSRYEPAHSEKERFEYSNVGVGLLGHLLASRLGMTWEEAVRERVLEPMGMDMTGLAPDARMQAMLAPGHDLGGDVIPSWDFGALAAAGGLFSTADDLLRFLSANLTEPRTDLQHAMRTAHHPRARVDRERTIGLTWQVRATGDRRTVWHNGATSGHRAFVGFDPDREIGVVVLANSGPGVDDLGFHLLDPTIPLDPPEVPGFATRPEGPTAGLELARYVGEYFVLPEARLRVDVAHGRLWARLPGQPPHAAYSDGRGGFFLRAVEVELAFETDRSGGVVAAVIRRGEKMVRARKVDERIAQKPIGPPP